MTISLLSYMLVGVGWIVFGTTLLGTRATILQGLSQLRLGRMILTHDPAVPLCWFVISAAFPGRKPWRIRRIILTFIHVFGENYSVRASRKVWWMKIYLLLLNLNIGTAGLVKFSFVRLFFLVRVSPLFVLLIFLILVVKLDISIVLRCLR